MVAAVTLTPYQIAAECRRIAGIIGPEAVVVAATHSNYGDWNVQVYTRGMIGNFEHFLDDPLPELLRRAESYAREFVVARAGGSGGTSSLIFDLRGSRHPRGLRPRDCTRGG